MATAKLTDEEIVAMYREVKSIKAIPANNQRIYRVLAEAGLAVRTPSPYYQKRNAAIIADYQAGMAVGTLARKYDCTRSAVNHVLRKSGVRPLQQPAPMQPVGPSVPAPELGDPAQARTRLRMRLIERANASKLDAWRAA